jgi:serine/threonine protein kinase
VYKKIRQEDQDEKKWGRLQQEVQTLRARQHVNITPLLASFSAGLEIPSGPNDDTKCLYLISPRALMDMHDWMKKEPTYVQKLEDHEFRNHIWDAMRGLISGLTFVHRQIGGEVGYHGDLKPKNILLFESSPKWTWKICDFGSSNLKSIDETGTKNLRTSYYWAPKKYFVKDVHTDGQDHGRAHDVWSLGCIFLLLATMLRHRWRPEGLEEFKKLRAGNDDDDEAHAFHNSMHAVQQWIHGLETTAQRKRFKHIVKLVEEMLKPREERIFSWEVEVDLYCIIDADRPDKQILDHLKRVIQPARKADRGLKHDPLARARSRGRKGPFLDILMENEWYDEETTDEQKTAMIARRSISTLPPPEEKEPIFGRELLFNRISELFKGTRSVALSGLGGIG